jgi:hypothetical protein
MVVGDRNATRRKLLLKDERGNLFLYWEGAQKEKKSLNQA